MLWRCERNRRLCSLRLIFFFAKELTVVEYKMYAIKIELNIIKLNYT